MREALQTIIADEFGDERLVDFSTYAHPKSMAVGSEEFYRKGADNVAADLDFGTVERTTAKTRTCPRS